MSSYIYKRFDTPTSVMVIAGFCGAIAVHNLLLAVWKIQRDLAGKYCTDQTLIQISSWFIEILNVLIPAGFAVMLFRLSNGYCTIIFQFIFCCFHASKLLTYVFLTSRADLPFRESIINVSKITLYSLQSLIAVSFVLVTALDLVFLRFAVKPSTNVCQRKSVNWPSFWPIVLWMIFDTGISLTCIRIFVRQLKAITSMINNGMEVVTKNETTTQELLQKTFLLSVISVTSTFAMLFFMIIWRVDELALSLDALINSWCIALMFSNTKDKYKSCCGFWKCDRLCYTISHPDVQNNKHMRAMVARQISMTFESDAASCRDGSAEPSGQTPRDVPHSRTPSPRVPPQPMWGNQLSASSVQFARDTRMMTAAVTVSNSQEFRE